MLERAGLPSCPSPLSSASVEGEEERGEVGEEAVLLVPVPMFTSGVAPPGALCVESISVLGDTTEECLALEKVTILVGNPIANGVGACELTMLPGKNFWGNAAFVRTVWASAMAKDGEGDLGVTIGCGKVKRC
jgi:hypothetical protein